MRGGRTYTGHFKLETRQHELLGLDLGEGVPRRALLLGTLVLATWVGLLYPWLGAPNKATFSLYFLPPVFLAAYGMQASTRFPGRRRFTDWALRVHYLTRGHRPLIRLGARPAHRSEYLPLRDRLPDGAVAKATRAALPWRDPDDTHTGGREPIVGEVPAGPAITLAQRARLLDEQHLYHAYQRTYRRRRGLPTATEPGTAKGGQG